MSTLHRFFVTPDEIDGDRFPLPTTIRHQVERVLRLGDGDTLAILTGDGVERLCRLDGGVCVVIERRDAGGEATHRLTIAQALLKGDGLEDVVRQGTELGVAAFQLVVSDRCIADVLSPRKLERLRAIAREAAEQSERGRIPDIHEAVPLDEVLTPGTVLLAERSDGLRLRDLEPPSTIVIGPEGGFSPSELERARRAGVVLAGLGPRILRSRTVAVAAAAAVLSRTGDFA